MRTFAAVSTSVYAVRRDRVYELYRPILKPIVSTAIRRLPRTIERAELDQVAAATLIDAATRFEGYLRKRVRGAVFDAGRKDQQAQKCLPIDEFPEFAADGIPVDELIDQARRVGRARAAIRSLPAAERKVITMKSKGATTPQIASATGVSKRTVIRRHVAGVAALRVAIAA
jgi:RNA polymerase sigma factor (sigma-70 family)